ncbi:MAG: hypothetical protein JWL63_3570 [Rhodocyclales bacterium]|nr:hypothetical protein [Rhodocyclales bacterium]
MIGTRKLAHTDFSQSSQCLAALRALNPTDVDDSMAVMAFVLDGMCAHPPEPTDHLQVLEEMRTTLDFVMSQASQRYVARPLPPASEEDERLQRVVTGWTTMAKSYALIAQRSAMDPGFVDKRALLAHRRIQYCALAMVENFRARREMPPGLWRNLHGLFAASERASLSDVRVPDALNEVWGAQSAQECYVALLLVDAAMPSGRTPRELVWIMRWAQRFAPYCVVQADSEPRPDKATQFALDINADHGLRPIGLIVPEAPVRGIDTKRLANHIQAVVAQLKKGVSPASLGLGDDCVQPACSRLLVSLYRPWGHAAAGRKFPRRRLSSKVQLCVDQQTIAFFLEGREFSQPSDARVTSFSDTQVMRTFGERVESEITPEYLVKRAAQLGYAQEEVWQVTDQSVAGYRLARSQGDSRVEHRQLVGLRATPAAAMLLAEVSWLQYQHNGTLQAGVSLLPGPPKVMAVRLHLGDRSARERYRLGFMVPGIDALKTEVSLIVPSGWFLANRRVEIYEEGPWYARMVKLVSRGANFDRITFTREPAEDTVD